MTLSRLLTLLFSALVTLGVLRRSVPEAIRDHWSGWVIALAAVTFGVVLLWARSRETREERFEAYLLMLLPLVLAALYLQPQRVASDGIFYYSPLHSLVVDGDLDFENEYRVLGAPAGYFQRTETGRLPNNFSIGPALVWIPWFVLAHLLGVLGLYRPTGFGYPYFTAIATGTVVAGFVGVVCLFRFVRCYFPSGIAFVSTLLVWLATFHVWYMVFEPSMSHAMAMASVAGFLLLTHEGAHGVKAFVLLGALGGVVALMRWQNVVFVPVAFAVSWSMHGRPKVREITAAGAAFFLVFSPQLVYWKALYGRFFLIPQGGGYIDWTAPELEAVLFSSRHGLLSWAPVLWLGVLGLAGFFRRKPVLGGSLLGAILVAWYVNASVYDWWAGASFGSRRFDAALPAFALGIAVSLQWIVWQVERRPLVATGILLGPFVAWNVMLMGVYFEGAIPPDGPASFRQAAADGIELVYNRTGYPPSWPATLRRALASGTPLATYDLEGALALSNNLDIRMGDNDALYLGRGWTLPSRGRVTTRSTRGSEAEIFVALAEPAAYRLLFEGAPGGGAQLVLNGRPLGELTIGADGRAEVFVSSAPILQGVNYLAFEMKPRARLTLSRVSWRRPGGE